MYWDALVHARRAKESQRLSTRRHQTPVLIMEHKYSECSGSADVMRNPVLVGPTYCEKLPTLQHSAVL